MTKTNDQQYRDVFICDCYSTEHQVILHYLIEEEENEDPTDPAFMTRHELHFEIHLGTYKSFWKRLWYGLKYAFGYKSEFGDWDNFMFRGEDADKLIEYLTMLKQNHAEINVQLDKTIKDGR